MTATLSLLIEIQEEAWTWGGLHLGSYQVVRWLSGAWSQTDLSPATFQCFLGEVTALNLSFLICSLEVIVVPA